MQPRSRRDLALALVALFVVGAACTISRTRQRAEAQHPNLSPALLATIRLLVSRANHCDYCIDMNAGMLIGMFGLTPEQVATIRRDPSAAPFSAKDKALLQLVLKTVVQREPATRAELTALRAHGWSSADILDAVAHGARNVSVDVLLNAFAVENVLIAAPAALTTQIRRRQP